MVYNGHVAKRPFADIVNDSGGISNSDTTVGVENSTAWKRGDIGQFDDGELVFCSADGSGGNLTVVRGYEGSTAASQADNARLEKNPPFYRIHVEALINEVIRTDLWPHVWTWHNDTLTFTSGDTTYPLDAYIDEVVRVYQYNLNSDGRYWDLPGNWWEVERQVNTAVATNSGLFRIKRVRDATATVYYEAKRRPDPSDIANISAEVADLIPWRVCAKLAESNMLGERIDPPRQSRQNAEGGYARDARSFNAEFFTMREALNKKLRNEIPVAPRYVPRRARRSW